MSNVINLIEYKNKKTSISQKETSFVTLVVDNGNCDFACALCGYLLIGYLDFKYTECVFCGKRLLDV